MFYDVGYVWIWLLLAVLLGGVVGWRTETDGAPEPWMQGWFRVAVIVAIIAFLAAIFHLLPGRGGLWVETAVLFFVAYVIGGLIGGAVKRVRTPV